MAAEEENVSKVLSVLSHKIRREILLILHEKGETSFTDLMKTINVDTGKLSFHIRALSIFVEQTESGKYRLNRAGDDAVRVILDVQSWAEFASAEKRESLLPLASFSKRSLAFLIDFGIMFLLAVPLLLPALVSVVQNWALVTLNMLFAASGLLWGYSAILEGFSGQTVGKRALGLMAVRVDGKTLDYGHAVVRDFGKVLLPFDLIFGYMVGDPRYVRYFDKFAVTTVIDLRKGKASPELAPVNTGRKTEQEELAKANSEKISSRKLHL